MFHLALLFHTVLSKSILCLSCSTDDSILKIKKVTKMFKNFENSISFIEQNQITFKFRKFPALFCINYDVFGCIFLENCVRMTMKK